MDLVLGNDMQQTKKMKSFVLALLLVMTCLGGAINGLAQTSGPATNIRVFASNPTGNACSQTSVGLYGGALYTCQAGVYAATGGGSSFTSPVIVTSAANPCFAVGPNGATNPVLSADCSVASQATGVQVIGRAAGAGVTIGVTSSGSNESLSITTKGTGAYNINGGSSLLLTGDNTGYALKVYDTTSVTPVVGIFGNSAVKALRLASITTITWTNSNDAVGGSGDTALVRFAAGVIRATNNSTGAGQLLIGTSTDTADAQLSVYSQNTTRPGLKLRALSGTAGTQAAFENYDASGNRNLYITAAGTVLFNTDNAVDIGASGANRPRNVYVAGTGTFGSTVTVGGTLSLLSTLRFGSNGGINGSTDGIITLYNNAATDFNRLQFGGTSSSFPALKRSSAALEVRLADDSAYAAHRALTYGVNNACVIRSGSGSPESAVTGNVCDLYLRTDGGAATTLYVKESGTGNTGWVGK